MHPHIKKQMRAAVGTSPIIIPDVVKTPFPPLNLAKIVHICPTTAENPAIICTRVWSRAIDSAPILEKNIVVVNPFPRSIIPTINPGFQPRTLITFVKPAFPLP